MVSTNFQNQILQTDRSLIAACFTWTVQQGVSTFNDDIESTAAAVLAAILGAAHLEGVPALEQQTFVLVGAGQANIGSARLLTKALVTTGLLEAEAKKKIWMFDSKARTSIIQGHLYKELSYFCLNEIVPFVTFAYLSHKAVKFHKIGYANM